MSATELNTAAPAWTFTRSFHKAPYPAISPSRPELSQAGKTVLVTGGNAGIGYAIANAFLEASAAKVIVTGRRAEATKAAAASLAAANPDRGEAVGLPCDVADAEAVGALWNALEAEGTTVDVLVLNAVKVADAKPLLDSGVVEVWATFEVNVRAQLQMTERFYRQKGEGVKGPKNLINVSSFSIHDHNIAADRPAYGLTKNAAALTLQLIAQDTSAEKMQVVSMNPGGVLTAAARSVGCDEDSYPWNSRKCLVSRSVLRMLLKFV
ncbi:NAD(P)-binding protein [Karstenula rhodostoma CBS 690.94]|uniref:NAD(P)-binding protein n=1 Tax=Karstenula rhodostoma CBS 690.94 TaxID=1392251 RepID=A0A9P4P7D2_9PLEO|nr:NAD(P)-binding protein [Karstenula rhodostoma CBS 690.94]